MRPVLLFCAMLIQLTCLMAYQTGFRQRRINEDLSDETQGESVKPVSVINLRWYPAYLRSSDRKRIESEETLKRLRRILADY
uniref:Secreted protein n=1 Tax=Mesocestoides corti TaxID=53468 RepID=A0A5K3FJ66_MESCO